MSHPAQLGKYSVTGVLGEGAMGIVYRGFDPDIRRTVALKTIRRQAGEGFESAANSAVRFRNEARAAGRLQHPGIVGVYDFGDDGRVAYIAMEYVEGQTLARHLAQRVRFSLADVASVAAQLLDALSHAHEHRVWHRDIKPSNVIMTPGGRVKIADFGIARTDNSGLTMANSVLGTPMYMAPEQFMGLPVDHRVDLYATGVLLYQLLTGRPPFEGAADALMFKVINEVPPPPSTLAGAAPVIDAAAPDVARFDAAVATAMAKDPAARFASAAAFRDAVAAALGQPIAPAVSPSAVLSAEAPTTFPATERLTPVHSTATALAQWDPKVLAEVEATLARHVGPLAGVMVRRAARECRDVAALHARLAEQITQPTVREAFLGLASRSGAGTRPATGSRPGSRTGTGAAGASGVGAGSGHFAAATHYAPAAAGPPVSDAQLEQAQRVLALHLGPIARVVVKRAAERTRQREALFELLAEAVPAPVRERVLAELVRLG